MATTRLVFIAKYLDTNLYENIQVVLTSTDAEKGWERVPGSNGADYPFSARVSPQAEVQQKTGVFQGMADISACANL